MIDIRIFHNAACLKCKSVESEMLKVGAFVMCKKCKKEEFGDISEISPESMIGKKYYKWVKGYTESEQ